MDGIVILLWLKGDSTEGLCRFVAFALCLLFADRKVLLIIDPDFLCIELKLLVLIGQVWFASEVPAIAVLTIVEIQ